MNSAEYFTPTPDPDEDDIDSTRGMDEARRLGEREGTSGLNSFGAVINYAERIQNLRERHAYLRAYAKYGAMTDLGLAQAADQTIIAMDRTPVGIQLQEEQAVDTLGFMKRVLDRREEARKLNQIPLSSPEIGFTP